MKELGDTVNGVALAWHVQGPGPMPSTPGGQLTCCLVSKSDFPTLAQLSGGVQTGEPHVSSSGRT